MDRQCWRHDELMDSNAQSDNNNNDSALRSRLFLIYMRLHIKSGRQSIVNAGILLPSISESSEDNCRDKRQDNCRGKRRGKLGKSQNRTDDLADSRYNFIQRLNVQI